MKLWAGLKDKGELAKESESESVTVIRKLFTNDHHLNLNLFHVPFIPTIKHYNFSWKDKIMSELWHCDHHNVELEQRHPSELRIKMLEIQMMDTHI